MYTPYAHKRSEEQRNTSMLMCVCVCGGGGGGKNLGKDDVQYLYIIQIFRAA